MVSSLAGPFESLAALPTHGAGGGPEPSGQVLQDAAPAEYVAAGEFVGGGAGWLVGVGRGEVVEADVAVLDLVAAVVLVFRCCWAESGGQGVWKAKVAWTECGIV